MNEPKTTTEQLKDLAILADILQNVLEVGYSIYDEQKRGYVCDAAFYISQQVADRLHDIIREIERKESKTA